MPFTIHLSVGMGVVQVLSDHFSSAHLRLWLQRHAAEQERGRRREPLHAGRAAAGERCGPAGDRGACTEPDQRGRSGRARRAGMGDDGIPV